MKKDLLLLSICLFIINNFCLSQTEPNIFKFKAVAFRSIINDGKGSFSQEGEFKDISFPIILDDEHNTLNIYSPNKKDYSFVKKIDAWKDFSGATWISWSATDNEGATCMVRFQWIHTVQKESYNAEIFVDYADHSLEFRMYNE